MSDDEGAGGSKPAAGTAAAANLYDSKVFLTMENVLEKLKLLNYEISFCAPKHVAPFARTAFSLPAKNPSVQFQHFLDMVSWLCLEATQNPSTFSVDKFDDPNTSINKMMLALRDLGFGLDFSVAKLRQGHGEAVCNVLDFLCEKALGARGFSWGSPVHEEPAEVEEAEVDEDADMGDIADETEAVVEDEGVFDAGVGSGNPEKGDSDYVGVDAEAHQIIENTIDPLLWKTELERVGPRLKTQSATLGKEWRAHIEQTKEHEKTIQAVLPDAQGHMKSISAQILEAVEKMKAKEGSINSQMDSVRSEYEELKAQAKIVNEKHETTQASVGALTSSMTDLQDQLDEMKEDMAGRENSATDTSPLVNIKQALVAIKGDVQTFDLQIGVVGHTLMQAKPKVAKLRTGLNSGSAGAESKGGSDDDDDFDDQSDYH
mmetsp:Transcript_65979/g.148906  ORF Transcript_65979/g.148906 Transcript_65979/m.148906 type:complete len:431 (-) Transcript_65979:141-1433(-)